MTITPFVAPVGLVNLQAPLPPPRRFDLLHSLDIIEPTDDRWLGGAWTEGQTGGPAFTHDPCSTGSDRVKQPSIQAGTQTSGVFTVYLPAFCTAVSVGPNPEFWTAKLEKAFRLYEGAAVERILATGDGQVGLGPYLCDDNLERLTGLPTDPVSAFGLLEEAVARHGGGVIHAAPRTFTQWVASTLVSIDDGRMVSALGTPVVIGYGYVGAVPNGGPAPTSTQEWAFASGPIEVYRDAEITTIPGDYDEAIDRAFNDVVFIAERPYLFNWMAREAPDDDAHIQAGVLIDFSLGGGTGGGTGFEIEVPSGVIDGVNDTFVLSMIPSPSADLMLWKNGLFMEQGIDYMLVDATITFVPAQIPPLGANLVAAVPTGGS